MGADIHMYVEKLNNDNEWEYIYIKDKDNNIVAWYPRDYTLFGLLAEVRREGYDDLTKVQGLPYNMSDEVNQAYEEYKDDYHSATWYMLSELDSMRQYLIMKRENIILSNLHAQEEKVQLKEEYESIIGSLTSFCNAVEFICSTNSAYSPDKARVIVWFDN